MFTSSKSSLFTRLGAMASSGLSWPDALRRLGDSERGRLGRSLDTAAKEFDRGEDPRDCYEKASLFTVFERELLVGGHISGKLPMVCKTLADLHSEARTRLFGSLIALAYPVLMIHVTILVSCIFGAKSINHFLIRALIRFFIFYMAIAIPAAGIYVLRLLEGPRKVIDHITLAIPFLGSYVRTQQVGLGLLILGHLYSAGIDIITALDQTSRITSNTVLADVWFRVKNRVEHQETLTVAFSAETAMPKNAIDYISSGEASGRLDEMLFHGAKEFATASDRQFKVMMGLLIGLIFGSAMFFAAYTIISFWMGYFEKINKITGR